MQGLLYTRDPTNGNVLYHMFSQPSDSGQAQDWGHASSPDLVRWTRLRRTGMQGSSGGAIALPAEFKPPPELAGAVAIAISSSPKSPLVPGTTPPGLEGLHLYYSTGSRLTSWTRYRNESKLQASNNATCIICPEDVPNKTLAGYLGDTYVWRDGKSFYVLAGSNRCAASHPWCGWDSPSTSAQALLFRSSDLLRWEYISDWRFLPKQKAWPAGVPQDGPSYWPARTVDTPDTFALRDASTGQRTQVFVWQTDTAGCNTQWMLGQLRNASGAFVPSTRVGCADRGIMYSQQSLWQPDSERVSIGWLRAEGDGWGGVQSLARVVTLDESGLRYSPLPDLGSLHEDYQFWRAHSLEPDVATPLPALSQFGASLHLHLALEGGSATAPSASVSSIFIALACLPTLMKAMAGVVRLRFRCLGAPASSP